MTNRRRNRGASRPRAGAADEANGFSADIAPEKPDETAGVVRDRPEPGAGAARTPGKRQDDGAVTGGRIPDFPVTRSHPPASWPSAANSSICRTYRKTAGEESRRRSPVANRWMRP